MEPITVEGVPCYLQSDIQGEKIPEIPDRFPFRRALLDQLVELCPVVTEENLGDRYEYGIPGSMADSPIGLRWISYYHRRSFEVAYGEANRDGKPIAVWEDEYENPFTA